VGRARCFGVDTDSHCSAASAISYKFGYGDDVETFKKEAMKFSLLLDGTLDTPGCTKLLIVNVSNRPLQIDLTLKPLHT